MDVNQSVPARRQATDYTIRRPGEQILSSVADDWGLLRAIEAIKRMPDRYVGNENVGSGLGSTKGIYGTQAGQAAVPVKHYFDALSFPSRQSTPALQWPPAAPTPRF